MGDCDGERSGGMSEVEETVQGGRSVESEGSAAAECGQGTGRSRVLAREPGKPVRSYHRLRYQGGTDSGWGDGRRVKRKTRQNTRAEQRRDPNTDPAGEEA